MAFWKNSFLENRKPVRVDILYRHDKEQVCLLHHSYLLVMTDVLACGDVLFHRYKRILVLVSHSQDFLNGVCTNIIHLHLKGLVYYGVSHVYQCSL